MSHDWRTFPSLTALRAFDATARHGNFARAARALDVTDAAVSQQVRSLEDDLGVRLAIRQGRSIELTDEGRSLAKSLASAFDEIGEEVASLRAGSRQRALRATTTPYLTDLMIVPRLAEFWKAHPGAEISLSPRSDYVDVVREGFDVGIRAHPRGRQVDWPGTEVIRLADVGVIAIASPYAAAAARHDVQKLPWLWHDGMETKEAMMRACGVDVDHIQRVPIGSPNLLLEATRQGLGATLFNELIGKQLVEAGDLIEVATPDTASMTYYAVLPKGPRHPLADSFVDWIAALFRRPSPASPGR